MNSPTSGTEPPQPPITEEQAKTIFGVLYDIRQSKAGQSFKAPVEKLWPQYANAYNTKISNPIDLETIEIKMKQDLYPSLDKFRLDIELLYQNSVEFNGTDHFITRDALEVRNILLDAIGENIES